MHSEKSILGLSTLDGTLSPDEFRVGAHNFAEKWERVCHSHDHDLPLWSWVSCENPTFVSPNEVGGYLSSEKMCILRSDKTDDDGICHVREEEPNSFENRDSSDPAALVLPTHEVHYYDFHIVYNNSYRIPVLYFRGYHCDGQPLLLDEIEKDLPANSAKLLTESKWTFITQEVLGCSLQVSEMSMYPSVELSNFPSILYLFYLNWSAQYPYPYLSVRYPTRVLKQKRRVHVT